MDCGHAADLHREELPDHAEGFVDDAPSCTGAGPGFACSCKRTVQAVNHAGDLAVELQHQERRRYGYALLTALLLALAVGIGSVLASYRLAEQGRTESEQKMCEVLKLSIDNASRAQAAYERQPPTTPAGKEQMAQLQVGLNAVTRLAQSYGCAAVK